MDNNYFIIARSRVKVIKIQIVQVGPKYDPFSYGFVFKQK